MKKKLFLLALCAVTASSLFAGRRRHHHGHHGHHGYWGPSVGFGVTIPVGGNSGAELPPAVRQYNKLTGKRSHYLPSEQEFCRWAQSYFVKDKAKLECEQYQNFLAAPPPPAEPAGAISLGVGGGYPYGGYPYGGYPGYPYWW